MGLRNLRVKIPGSIFSGNIRLLPLFAICASLFVQFDGTFSAQPINSKVSQISSGNKERSSDDGRDDSQNASKYATKPYPSVPSTSASYYGSYPSPYSNGYYNPGTADNYNDGYYDRPVRQFSARSSTYPMAAAASSQVGFAEPEYGGLMAETGHGGGHSGGHGGNGWGWGWGQGSHHTTYHESVTKYDNSSIGLLGLMGLLSLLSNVLALINAARANNSGRRRREVDFYDEPEDRASKIEQVCQQILPSLNIIGNVQNRLIPRNCTHVEVCKSNKILANEFGHIGRVAGSMMSESIVKLLKDTDKSTSTDKELLKASLDGREGKNCESIWPICNALHNGVGHLPQLLSPKHVSAILQGQNPQQITPDLTASYLFNLLKF